MQKIEYSVVEDAFITKFTNVKPRNMTVYISDEGQPTSIFCMYCKKKLFDCQHQLIQLIPGSPPIELKHIRLKCGNPGCNTFYYFVSVV